MKNINYRLHFLVFYLLLLVQWHAFGQNPPINCADINSNLGGFEVNFRKGCVGKVLEIKETITGATNLKYSYDFFPTSTSYTLTDKKEFLITKAGTYSILQQGTNKDGKNFNFCRNSYVVVYDSEIKPKFEVKLLAGARVSMVIFNGVYDEYVVDWGDGSKLETVVQNSQKAICHAYSGYNGKEALITLTGFIRDAGCNNFSQVSTKIDFLTISKPTVSRLEVSGTKAELTLAGPKGIDLEIFIQRNTGLDFSPTVQKYNQVGNAKHLQAGMDNSTVNCFKVVAVDGCDADIESLPICTVPLQVYSLNKKAIVKWKTNPDFVGSYEIYRDGQLIKTVNTPNYEDKDVACNQKYCYKIIAKTATTQSISEERCTVVSGADTLSKLTNTFVTIENNKPVLLWETPKNAVVENYFVSRAERLGGNFIEIAKPITNKYVDSGVNPTDLAFCYQVAYQDLCKNISPPSTPFCPVSLKANTSLSWLAYQEFNAGLATYIVERIDENGQVLNTFDLKAAQQFRPQIDEMNRQSAIYRIKAISKDGLNSYSNQALQFFNPILYVPDIVTPNNDGVNDQLVIKSVFVKSITIEIFDRWGAVVYAKDPETPFRSLTDNSNTNSWNIDLLPSGVYVYRLKYADLKDQIFTKNGSIVLQRE
jgi:gliding motility-associated-like protein